MCLLHCDLGLFPFQGQNIRAEVVSRKKIFLLKQSQTRAEMHILYKNPYWKAKHPIIHIKSNNSPLTILYSHTLVKERDRHQGTGVELGGFNSV